jgi:hypothetical protein
MPNSNDPLQSLIFFRTPTVSSVFIYFSEEQKKHAFGLRQATLKN